MNVTSGAPAATIGGVPVIFRPARPIDDPVGRYPGLQLTITGASPLHPDSPSADSRNAGEHVLHTGGRHPARLLLPVIDD